MKNINLNYQFYKDLQAFFFSFVFRIIYELILLEFFNFIAFQSNQKFIYFIPILI